MNWNNINEDRDTSGLGPIEYDQSKVPTLIRKHADNVRTKTYGQEVREAQARNAEVAGLIASEALDSSNETKGRQDDVETQFNAVQQELTDKDPISAPEIIAARNGEATLNDRLDKEQQEFNEKLAHMVSIDFISDCGAKPEPDFNNYNAFIMLKQLIDSYGRKNIRVNIPQGDYYYKPLLPLTASWRTLVQIEDFEDIYIYGDGAKIHQIFESTWNANGTPSGQLEHESPFQFRNGKGLRLFGFDINGARIEYTGVDGSCSGIYLREVEGFILKDIKSTGWGTDGATFSRNYNNGGKCKIGIIQDSVFDNNRRQGVSVTGADNVVFFNTQFKNTNGGSFGHGLDLETNFEQQYNISVISCDFENNERGAMNFIGTEDVVVDACNIKELNTDGAFYFDGGSRPARNIKVINSTIKTNRAVCFLVGSSVSDVTFENNDITTTGRANEGATIRMIPLETNNVDNIIFKRNKFRGIGGILTKINGRFVFEDNDVVMSNISQLIDYLMVFDMQNETSFKGNRIKIENSVEFSIREFKIRKGIMENNEFESHGNAQVRVLDDRRNDTLKAEIGRNKFSQYFYYYGEVFGLNVYQEDIITRKGILGRYVHGGYSRTTSGLNPRVNDLVEMISSENEYRLYRCTVAGTPTTNGTWVRTI